MFVSSFCFKSEHARYAHEYAQSGCLLVPLYPVDVHGTCGCGVPNCAKVTEHPTVALSAASSDPAQIEEWWESSGSPGIGAVTGQRSALIAVVASSYYACDKYVELRQANHTEFTLGYPNGAAHCGYCWLFRYAGEVPTTRIAPGLEIRGDEGLIALPPSRDLNGKPNYWMDDDDILDAPPWLVSLARSASALQLDRTWKRLAGGSAAQIRKRRKA